MFFVCVYVGAIFPLKDTCIVEGKVKNVVLWKVLGMFDLCILIFESIINSKKTEFVNNFLFDMILLEIFLVHCTCSPTMLSQIDKSFSSDNLK